MVAPTNGVAVVGAVAFSDNDDEISRTWKMVEERVLQMAGGDRSKIKQGLGIESVLSYLDEAQTKDAKASEKYSAIKNIFNRTLQCIQTVGGIVADGASYVFAPSNTCFNALTFVIQAWRGYEGIFDSLASLLEKCTEFLDRLTYYSESGMDAKLTKVACQHLHFFVEICDRSLNLKSKRNKLKAFMKQMFLNDDGVQDLLSRMESLVNKERGLVAAQTWKSSNDAASFSKDGLSLTRKVHNAIVDDKNQLMRDKEMQKWKVAIVDALECDRSILDADALEPWEKAWKRHKSDILEGTGDWLVQHPSFKSWVTGSHPANPILGLEGGDGAGKTLLASNAILHLRKLKTMEKSGSRVVVAHNFMETDSKTPDSSNDLTAVSRNLMCQLALGDESFMKSVAGICEKAKDFKSPLDMWTQLLLENEDHANIDVTFFIVLDDLGDDIGMFTHLLQRFSDHKLVQKTRILLTGKRKMFDALYFAGGVVVDKIILGGPNKKDIELYINNCMDGMEILKDTKRAGVVEMRAKILKELQESTDGDYYKISRVLDNISKTDEVEEIDEYLRNAGDTRPDQIERDIANLEKIRSPKEISEINEMILWTITGREWMNPSQMEALLALKAGTGTALTSQRTSLMSIESKIKTKYTLFHVEYGYIYFKASEMKDKIPLKNRDASDTMSSSGFKEIQPAEVNIIKHYLSTVCPTDLYQKFGFDEFFEQKMVRKGNYICQDPDNAEIVAALRCMACLIEERAEKIRPFYPYSLEYVLYHLTTTDLSLADRELKAEVGTQLVRLFTEEYATNSLFGLHRFLLDDDEDETIFNLDNVPASWKTWFFTNEGLEGVKKWFKDSAAIEKVKDHPLITAFNEPDAMLHQVLFGDLARRLANELFLGQPTKRESLEAFTILLAILKAGMELESSEFFDPSLEMVELVENWAQEILEITEKDAVWESQAAGLLTYLAGENIPRKEAEARARKALELDPNNYSAFYFLSQTVESEGEAISILEDAIQRLLGDDKWKDAQQLQVLLAGMILDLGNKYWEDAEHKDIAIATYFKIFEVSSSYFIIKEFSTVLNKLAEVEEWDTIVAFLEKIVGDTEEGWYKAGTFVIARYWEEGESWGTILERTTKATDRFDFFSKLFLKAIESNPEPYRMDVIKNNYGNWLFEFEGHEDEAYASWEGALEIIPEQRRWWALQGMSPIVVRNLMKTAAKYPKGSKEAEAWYAKIDAFYKDFEATNNKSTEPRVAYAHYFTSRGDTQRAREAIRPCVVRCLEMLSDDDLENDYLSYWELNQIFSALDDMPNDLVAWEMLAQSTLATWTEYQRKLEVYNQAMAKLAEKGAADEAGGEEDGEDEEDGEGEENEEETNEEGDQEEVNGEKSATDDEDEQEGTSDNVDEEEEAGEAEEEQEGEAEDEEEAEEEEETPVEPELARQNIAFCDGQCGNFWAWPSELWTCLSEAGQVQLCNDCYAKLIADEQKLTTKICDKNHNLHYIPKRDEERMAGVPKGSVLVGERVVTFEAWKDEIRAKYLD